MDEAFSFFIRHGGSVLFWAVFAEQIGLPLPVVLVWNKEQLRNSTTKLLNYSFEWVLPGRGCCGAALRSANSQLSEETQ
jgi:hypothetical protein